MSEGFNRYQYSQFDSVGGQYVVRTDDAEEFKDLVKKVHLAVGTLSQASQTPKSAPTSDSKPKVPYMWSGDTCPLCGKGKLVPTVKETKEHKKYDALVCDQDGCWGKAYPSKFPKFPSNATPFPKEEVIQVNPNDDSLPF